MAYVPCNGGGGSGNKKELIYLGTFNGLAAQSWDMDNFVKDPSILTQDDFFIRAVTATMAFGSECPAYNGGFFHTRPNGGSWQYYDVTTGIFQVSAGIYGYYDAQREYAEVYVYAEPK